jgi:phenylalanyl-tRNA synthetase beta chain
MIGKETRHEDAEASEEVLYKIEIPANRYDLLSTEGLSIALRNFLSLEECPLYHLDVSPRHDAAGKPMPMEEIRVEAAVTTQRPFIFAAILREVTLDAHAYASFIKMQDKLHQTIAR